MQRHIQSANAAAPSLRDSEFCAAGAPPWTMIFFARSDDLRDGRTFGVPLFAFLRCLGLAMVFGPSALPLLSRGSFRRCLDYSGAGLVGQSRSAAVNTTVVGSSSLRLLLPNRARAILSELTAERKEERRNKASMTDRI